MRTIYPNKRTSKYCPSCGGGQVLFPVGWTVGGEPVYSCKDKWHIRTIRQAEISKGK